MFSSMASWKDSSETSQAVVYSLYMLKLSGCTAASDL